MNENQKQTTRNKVDRVVDDNWKLYELLWRIVQHNHYRWVNNYRNFLTFNAFLLPAVIALLGYAIKENVSLLRLFVALLCATGAYITYISTQLLKRIGIDTKIRFEQLNQVEASIQDMATRPFRQGKEFFFERKDIPGFRQEDYLDKGMTATDAYKKSNIVIIVCYIIIGVCGILSLLLR